MKSYYSSFEEKRDAYARAADAKLHADHVDRTDIQAVKACLSECVLGHALYRAWRAVHAPQMELSEHGS
jgi:hypothetical protein